MPAERTCRGECGRTLPLTSAHFYGQGYAASGAALYKWKCTDCYNAERAVKAAARSAEQVEADRAANAERARRRRLDPFVQASEARYRALYWQRVRDDPELHERTLAVRRAWRERVKAERPELWQGWLEYRRIWYRSKRAAIGKTVREREVRGEAPTLPSLPLATKANAEIARRGLSSTHVCEAAGFDPRLLYAWANEDTRPTVTLEIADGLLMALDLMWWDVWPEATLLEVFGATAPIAAAA